MSKMSEGINTDSENFAQIFVHLLAVAQELFGQKHGVAHRLCQEVAWITQGRAQLFLHHHTRLKGSLSLSTTPDSFPVEFNDRIYGTLSVASDPVHSTYASLPHSVAHLLAQTCGWLLYIFEISVFIQEQIEHLNPQIHGDLTKREQEVLELMCRGYDQRAIASELNISPATVGKHRQNIYGQLDVHCERDVPLVAYQLGLFSPIEESSP